MDLSDINAYLSDLARHDDPVLLEMEGEAHRLKFPIVGPAAGRFCYLLARAINARKVFEMGSGFGYSTAWFAKAVRDNGGGVVYHVVWDEDLSRRARSYLAAAQLDAQVKFVVGEAVHALRQTVDTFDLIFNDIDKEGYPASIPVAKSKLRRGGIFLVDNMLWQGRIFDAENRSATTEGVRELTRILHNDPDFVCSVVPIRDGILVALKVR